MSPLDHKDWQVAYAWVEEQAKIVLSAESEGAVFSTSELASVIYTRAGSRASEKEIKRIYKALMAGATRNLRRYVTIGEPEKIGPRVGRRKTWHRPGQEIIPPPVKTCPTCGRAL